MMPKFKVKIEIDYDGELGVDRLERPLSKSHKNALMREAVWLQVADAMAQYGLQATIKSVVVARVKEGK
jgi:hypothetical protein